MREFRTIIDTYCDIHMRETDAQVEAIEEISFQLGGKPMRLDVCADHKDPRWSAVLAYAIPDVNPSALPPKPPARTTHPCPIPNCVPKKAITSQQGLSVHLSKVHKEISLAERQRLAGFDYGPAQVRKAERGAKYRADKDNAKTVANNGRMPCPIEGCHKSGANEHGLRMHLTSSHQITDGAERDRLVGRKTAHHGHAGEHAK
jgi:hypothetical protein